MIYVQLVEGGAREVASNVEGAQSRWDWKTFQDAQKIAAALNVYSPETYVATDSGPNVSPRYDVIKLPKVGDKVSYSFNGDTYPCGTVKSVSPSLKLIVTTEGQKFYRRGETGKWIYNGTWSLVGGHIEERNPHI